MTKLTLSDIANLQNENTAVSLLNANSALIETAMDNTLSRDGSTPNQMEAQLDMNSNQIINLPEPNDVGDPIRYGDLETLVAEIDPDLHVMASDAEGIAGTSETLLMSPHSTKAAIDNNTTVLDLGTASHEDIGTSGATVPLLSTNNFWSRQQNVAGSVFSTGGTTDATPASSACLAYPSAGNGASLIGVGANASTASVVRLRQASSDFSVDRTLFLGNATGTINLPTYNSVGTLTVDANGLLSSTAILPIAKGGTNASSASGTALDNITGFSSTGILARTGSGTYAFRTLTGPAAGISVTNGNGVSGNQTLALANDLAAVEGISTTGLATRTATDTWTARTLTGTANELTVTNGNGVSGNPTISIPTAVTFTGKTVTGGSYTGAAIDNTPIGATTASTGAFTTLTTSGLHTLNGGQILFPSTQNPSSNVNCLDDYEEGSWTPDLTFGVGGNTGIAYGAQTLGKYIKIGKAVFLWGLVILTSKGSSTGVAQIGGIPFTATSSTPCGASIGYYTGFSGLTGMLGMSLAAATPDRFSILQSGATQMATVSDTAFTNTSRIDFSAFYLAAA